MFIYIYCLTQTETHINVHSWTHFHGKTHYLRQFHMYFLYSSFIYGLIETISCFIWNKNFILLLHSKLNQHSKLNWPLLLNILNQSIFFAKFCAQMKEKIDKSQSLPVFIAHLSLFPQVLSIIPILLTDEDGFNSSSKCFCGCLNQYFLHHNCNKSGYYSWVSCYRKCLSYYSVSKTLYAQRPSLLNRKQKLFRKVGLLRHTLIGNNSLMVT